MLTATGMPYQDKKVGRVGARRALAMHRNNFLHAHAKKHFKKQYYYSLVDCPPTPLNSSPFLERFLLIIRIF